MEFEYKGQKIVCRKDGTCSFFLFNEDGDIDEYKAKNKEDAMARIDKILFKN